VSVRRILPYVAIAVVVGGLAWAFATIGTPGHARQTALDRRRITSIYEIASAMHDRFGKTDELPITLPPDLRAGGFSTMDTNDPETESPYTYQRIGRKTYRLCATFAFAYGPSRPADRGWKHPAGHTCFTFDVRQSTIEPDDAYDSPTGGSPPF
jgi:hypothetical protein